MKQKYKNEVYCLKSTFEKGIFYHIGIGDYLAPWDKLREIEQGYKDAKNYFKEG